MLVIYLSSGLWETFMVLKIKIPNLLHVYLIGAVEQDAHFAV